jgi:hypothetical protein
MPKAAPINADLIRAIFTYNPTTGHLIPKPTAALTARRINSKQWQVGASTYSIHRLVWAYHHPENPNPPYITFKDVSAYNPRIENLVAKNVHPRWEGYPKRINAVFDEYGRIVLVEDNNLTIT